MISDWTGGFEEADRIVKIPRWSLWRAAVCIYLFSYKQLSLSSNVRAYTIESSVDLKLGWKNLRSDCLSAHIAYWIYEHEACIPIAKTERVLNQWQHLHPF